MKVAKISGTIIILLVIINLFLFLWYVNPISFFGAPRVYSEETAIAIARDFDKRLHEPDDKRIFVGEYIESSGNWFVQNSPPAGSFGWRFIYVIRARDGRVINTRME